MVTQFANVFQHWIYKKKCSKVHLFQWYAWFFLLICLFGRHAQINWSAHYWNRFINLSNIDDKYIWMFIKCFLSKMHFISFFFFSFVSFMVKNENKHLYHTYTFCFKIKTIKIALFFYYLFWIIFYPFVVSLFHITFSFLAKFSL